MCTLVKTHQTVHFKWVPCTVCTLHLREVVFLKEDITVHPGVWGEYEVGCYYRVETVVGI